MILGVLIVICVLLYAILRRLDSIANSCNRIDQWTCDTLHAVDPENLYVSGR